MTRNSIRDARDRLSSEAGTIIKDWGGRLPVAIIYPNSYYIGMSNLGVQAIYGMINAYPHSVCERVFWDTDKRKPTLPLSIESGRPLADFSVIAFSVSYELDYFNIPLVLKAAGIPVYAKDRNESHPLVIAGGPCITANPLPLAPFFDCLCIGEAEMLLPAMMPVLADGVKGERADLFQSLSSLPGLYIPQIKQENPVKRQFTADLNKVPVHSVVLTPDTELGDLYLIEVERGCSWGCRFCLVSTTFSPMRFRSVDNLLSQAKEGLKFRKRLGLVGPAVTDHPKFEELIAGLQGLGAELSISSLRIRPLPTIALQEMAQGGSHTIALAPEAGSQRLRRVIRKNFSEDDILQAVEQVAGQPGITELKLYFMIGLPTETDEDIEEIIQIAFKCKAIIDRQGLAAGVRKRILVGRITLSISPFVPKANTPFQWLPMEQLATLNRRLSLLKNRLTPKGISVKSESPGWSQVQGVLARGDDKLANVLADIEEISLPAWRKALDRHGLDAASYIHHKWKTSDRLPWAILDSGIKPAQLNNELEKAFGE